MLILGLLSLLQLIFLPGFILIRLLQLNEGIIKTCVLSFALSLVLNHFLVFLLTPLHLYNRYSIGLIFVLETVLAIRLATIPSSNGAPREDGPLVLGSGDRLPPATSLSLGAAVITFCYFTYLLLSNLGQIFNLPDDVLSWNRWAEDWYNGHFPVHTWHYPQLLPTAWSITHVFIGNSEVQFFAKAIMPLFSLLTLCIMLDLWLRSRRLGYLVSVTSTGMLFYLSLGPGILTSGYADVPVAFLALTSVYLLFLARDADPARLTRHLYLGALCCAGGALTKQAGAYLAVLYPLLCYLIVLRPKSLPACKSRMLAVCSGIIFASVLPWYVYKQVCIRLKLDTSEVSYVTSEIYHGLSVPERITASFHLIAERFAPAAKLVRLVSFKTMDGDFVIPVVLGIIILCCLLCLRDAIWRIIVAVVALPFFFIWSCYFSYDLRNLLLVVPLFGIAIGVGFEQLLGLLAPKLLGAPQQPARLAREAADPSKTGQVADNTVSLQTANRVWLVPIMLCAAVPAVTSYHFTGDYLLQRQLSLQRMLCGPDIKRIFYDSGLVHTQGNILTDIQLCSHLPGFEPRCIMVDFKSDASYSDAMSKNAIRYILFPKDEVAPGVGKSVRTAIVEGRYHIIMSGEDRILIDTGGGRL